MSVNHSDAGPEQCAFVHMLFGKDRGVRLFGHVRYIEATP